MVHRKGLSLFIVLVKMHFIQRKHFWKTNATSHVFSHVSDLKVFPECPWAWSWTTLAYGKTVINQRKVVKSAFEVQSEKNSVRI